MFVSGRRKMLPDSVDAKFPTSGAVGWQWTEKRTLLCPRLGFYVMRLRRGAPLVPALIYQVCPMVMPQPSAVNGPNAEEWCRPLNRSPRFGALVDGKPVAVDRVWTSRSLRPVSPEEYTFRTGRLRRWARAHPGCRKTRPEKPVDLALLPLSEELPSVDQLALAYRPASGTTSRDLRDPGPRCSALRKSNRTIPRGSGRGGQSGTRPDRSAPRPGEATLSLTT
jgi:hypothetical protein